MDLRHGIAFMGVVVAAAAVSAEARAEESAYCRKVQARAASDAALLFAPSVQALGIKYPDTGLLGVGTTSGSGYQVRAQVTIEALDIYKGTRVLRAAEADCKHHAAAFAAEQALRDGVEAARLPALRRKAELLAAARPRWEEIVRTEQDRLDARVGGLLETNEVRARAAELERRAAQVNGEIAELEARGVVAPTQRISSLVESARANAMRLEREVSHIRSLEPWHVTATGGIIPQAPVDYYGFIQIHFNFGSFSRNAAETRYLDAREQELARARYELPDQLRRYRSALRAAAQSAQRELDALDRQASAISAAASALEGSEAPNAPHARAVLGLDAIFVESERGYLRAFMTELSRLEENHGNQ
jgi:hypothetical protein